MDETNGDEDPCGINRNVYTNKRKFQHEVLDLPVPKHACLDTRSTPETCFPSEIKSDIENSRKTRSNDNIHSTFNQIEQLSAKDSNSFSEDADSVMSVCNDSKNELPYLKICPYDRNSTSSVNRSGGLFDTYDEFTTNPAFGLYMCPSFEEQQLDCEEMSENGCSDYEIGDIKQSEDETLEDLLCSNGVVTNNFILSSGRWNVNQDIEQENEKLTIDVEFEQYFSMLML